MKKFIIVLMVVAAASFLLVGCLPGTTTPVTPVEPVEPVEPVVVATVAPIIIAVDAGPLVNKVEAADGIIVNGTAPTYSEVKIYINDICAGTGDTLPDGTWIVVVAKADLGADGDKVLYATAKEAALAVSAKSNEKKFTLDTVLPSIKSSSAKDGAAIVPLASTFASVGAPGFAGATAVPIGLAPNLVPGLWRIDSLGAHATANNIVVTNPVTGVQTTLNNVAGGQAIYTIPGVTFTFPATWVAGEAATVNCVAAAAAVLGYIDVTFSEAVTGASILALTSVWNVQSPLGAAVVDAPSVLSTTVARIFETVGGTLTAGDMYLISCSGISDLAGNAILATAPSTSTGIVLP